MRHPHQQFTAYLEEKGIPPFVGWTQELSVYMRLESVTQQVWQEMIGPEIEHIRKRCRKEWMIKVHFTGHGIQGDQTVVQFRYTGTMEGAARLDVAGNPYFKR